MDEFHHVPIMLTQVLEHMAPQPGETIVDGTLGGAGHSAAILERIAPNGKLIGFDKDQEALQAAGIRLSQYGDCFIPIHADFKQADILLKGKGIDAVDGVLLDLGVSSFQLDTGRRGFSYNQDAPLDMRMDQSSGRTAAEILNTYTKEELTDVIRRFGEERWAPRISDFIIRFREQEPIQTTGQLVELIMAAIPAKARRGGPHPAKRTFQALRIEVNGELEGLDKAVEMFVGLLSPGGRLAVITFHSLEDRQIKQTMKRLEHPCTCDKSAPICICGKVSVGRMSPSKPIVADEQELERNPRSRSAKLRIFRKNTN